MQTCSCHPAILPSFQYHITCHWASCEHEAAARAIFEGLSRRNRNPTAFYVHLSGAENIYFPDLKQFSRPGQKSTQGIGLARRANRCL